VIFNREKASRDCSKNLIKGKSTTKKKRVMVSGSSKKSNGWADRRAKVGGAARGGGSGGGRKERKGRKLEISFKKRGDFLRGGGKAYIRGWGRYLSGGILRGKKHPRNSLARKKLAKDFIEGSERFRLRYERLQPARQGKSFKGGEHLGELRKKKSSAKKRISSLGGSDCKTFTQEKDARGAEGVARKSLGAGKT